MNEKASYYMVIPASVWSDPELPPNCKLLYGHISTLANKYGVCTAENDYFAEQLGIKKDTVSRLVSRLANLGHITVDVVISPTGSVTGRNIQLALPGMDQGIGKKSNTLLEKNPVGYWKNFRPNIDNNTRDNIPPLTPQGEKAEKIEKSLKDEDAESGFAAFWELYPRHTCKQDARKAWKKLNPDAELQARIRDAILAECRTRQWTKDNGEYIPYPSTWLNGKRWENEHQSKPLKTEQRENVDRGDEW